MGPGDEDLGTPGGPADFHHIDLDVAALGELLAGDLFTGEQQGFGGLAAGADAQGDVARAGIDAGHHAGEDLMLLGVELVVHHAPLGLPQALDDDLLAVAGGDAAELHGVHGDVDDVAHVVLGGEVLGLLHGHLVGGIHVVLFLHHVLLYVHAQILVGLVHVHDDVFHTLMVPLVGGGQSLDDLIHHEALGNAPLLLQQGQGGKDLCGVEAHGLLLLFAFHGNAPYFIIYVFFRRMMVFLEFHPQADQGHVLLGEGALPGAVGDGDVPGGLVVGGEFAGELLAALQVPVELHQHGRAQKTLEIRGTLQGALGAGGAHLQGVAALDGVGLVQKVRELPGHGLTVQNVHAALLVQQYPQIPGACLPDVLHIPEGAALFGNGGSRQLRSQFGDFLHGHASSLAIPANFKQGKKVKKKSGPPVHSAYLTHLTYALYHSGA